MWYNSRNCSSNATIKLLIPDDLAHSIAPRLVAGMFYDAMWGTSKTTPSHPTPPIAHPQILG